MCFNGILRSKRSEALDAWIGDAVDSELIPIMRFARVLRRDIDAVNNAIELPWSNGQAEGQVNRRAMYGRAGTRGAEGTNAATASPTAEHPAGKFATYQALHQKLSGCSPCHDWIWIGGSDGHFDPWVNWFHSVGSASLFSGTA
jgi:hypothetical protein